MRFILTPIGSEGDLNPFIAIGRLLQSRGHDVVFIHDAHFTNMLAKVPLEKIAVGDPTAFAKSMQDPDIWHPMRSFRVIGAAMANGLQKHYDAIVGQLTGSENVIVAPLLAPAARLAGELNGVRVITVHLQPSGMASLHDTPVLASPHGHLLAKMPRLIRQLVYNFGSKMTDSYMAPSINAFRDRHGLQPVKNVLLGWINSPDGVLCLFPEWFGPAQPDWPQPNAHATFPDFDHGSLAPLDDDTAAFFSNSRPVIVTAGTANVHAARYFSVAIDALCNANVEGALLTRFREQLPKTLPGHVRWFPYLPFSLVLPKARGIMHHGGVGTMFQAMLAGAPQFVAPLAHDQFDHGWRIQRMGLGMTMPMAKISRSRVEEWLAAVSAQKYKNAANDYAARLRGNQFEERCVQAFSRLGFEV